MPPDFRMVIGTPLKVIWIDSMSDDHYWRTMDEVKEDVAVEPFMVEIQGYFIAVNDLVLYIAQTIFKEDGKICKIGGVFKIPLGCIIRIE